MSKDILLVVGSSTLASVMSQHLMNVDMVSFYGSILETGYKLVVVCDPITDDKTRNWFDAAIAPRVADDGQIVQVRHEIGVLANAPQAQVRMDFITPMPIEPIDLTYETRATAPPDPPFNPVPSGQKPVELAPLEVTQLEQPLPVNMPVLDEDGKIVTDVEVITAAHTPSEHDHGS